MKKTTKKPGMPYADSAIAKCIDKKIDELKGVKTSVKSRRTSVTKCRTLSQ